MCVIMASESGKMATKDQLEAGFKQNPWGAGIAWIDQDKDGPLVRWKKGIGTIEEVHKIVAAIPKGTPYVVHFRIPTEGLEDVELTHPFPISAGAEIAFEGTTRGLLLFHNGGWTSWRPFSLETCSRMGVKLPDGMLNDSRMMAWNAFHYGESILQLINEKALVFGLNPDGTLHWKMYGPDKANGWNFKGDRSTEIPDGVWFSNDHWEKQLPKPEPRTLTQVHSSVGGRGGDRPQGNFQSGRQSGNGSNRLSGRNALEGQVERRQKADRPRAESDGTLIHDPKFIAQMAKVHQDEDQLAWAMQINPKHYNRRVAGFIAAASSKVH